MKMFFALDNLVKITNIRGSLRDSLIYNEEILKLVETNFDWEKHFYPSRT